MTFMSLADDLMTSSYIHVSAVPVISIPFLFCDDLTRLCPIGPGVQSPFLTVEQQWQTFTFGVNISKLLHCFIDWTNSDKCITGELSAIRAIIVVKLWFKTGGTACAGIVRWRALCGAIRSNTALLMCFLNYPYWIHYLFARLNLLNLAALQQRNDLGGNRESAETSTCGRTSKFTLQLFEKSSRGINHIFTIRARTCKL